MDKITADIQTRLSQIVKATEGQTNVQEMVARLGETISLLIDKATVERRIMKAKRLLMRGHNWSEDRAYKYMRRTAKSRRIKIEELADEIINNILKT